MCHLKGLHQHGEGGKSPEIDGTGINGPGYLLKQLWKEWDFFHFPWRCKLFWYGSPSTISEAARMRSDKVQNQAPLLRKIIWKREQQRKKEVEMEDISYCSSASHCRGSFFGEPMEEGTEFNEDIFPQQTVAVELGNPLDCDEVHRATEHVKASATGKDEVLPKSRTANGNALRVCEIHRYHVWILDQGGTLFRIGGGARKGANKDRQITKQPAFCTLDPEVLPELVLHNEFIIQKRRRGRSQRDVVFSWGTLMDSSATKEVVVIC